jgi:hypothetical protein
VYRWIANEWQFLTANGTADRPITIKAAGDGDVTFDGNGTFNLVQREGRELQVLRRRNDQATVMRRRAFT